MKLVFCISTKFTNILYFQTFLDLSICKWFIVFTVLLYSRWSDAVLQQPVGGPGLGPVEDGAGLGLHPAAVSGRGAPHTQLHRHLLRQPQRVSCSLSLI